MARRQTKTADSLPLVAIDMGSDSVRAMAARRIAPDLFQILGVEERPQKMGNVCVEQGIITQSSNAGYVIAQTAGKPYWRGRTAYCISIGWWTIDADCSGTLKT